MDDPKAVQHQQAFQQPQQPQQYHQQQQVHQAGQGAPRGASGHLANRAECAQDIAKYCSKIPPENDIAMLQCLQDLGEDPVEVLSGDCEHLVWQYKDGPRDNHPDDKLRHSQGSTLQCLIEKIVDSERQAGGEQRLSLDAQCRHEVMRLAELQSDDYHLDRPLFFACRLDRERFCRDVQAGEGKVFQCLLQYKDQEGLSAECRRHLIIRAELIAQDYKASHLLVQSCAKDIGQYNCKPHQDHDAPEHFLLSFVLLCLENVAHSSQRLDPQCQEQVVNHRQLMMSDYRMSPEVVLSCQEDIKKHCGDQVEGGGRTLHCLMGIESGQTQRRQGVQRAADGGLKSECKAAIAKLIKVADPGSDYRVDVALYRSCRGLIEGACRQEGTSESEMLSCLMNHIETQEMSPDCEDRLMEIQYFLSRDFTLDDRLYTACHQDAVKLCSAPQNWHQEPNEQTQPDVGPGVFGCLHRNTYAEDGSSNLSRRCREEVRRVMRDRAVSVHLMPAVEEACRLALAAKCSQDTKPGDEMKCLQELMEEDDFQHDYPKMIPKKMEKFTEAESDDIRLNRALTRACRPVIENYCKELLDEEIDHGDVMECLQRHKGTQEMNNKCRSYVNFYTMVSLRNYKFSATFKRVCTEDIKKHCADISTNDKTEIIRCLGEAQMNFMLLAKGEGLSKKCKRQLRDEFVSMENAEMVPTDPSRKVDMNAGFWKVCKKDIQKSGCLSQGHDSTHKVMECLKQHHLEEGASLEAKCQKLLFGLERIEMMDNRMDVELMESCHQEIRSFCQGVDPKHTLRCLKANLRQPGMGAQCLDVIKTRMYEQAQDIRLRPGLLLACREDLQQLCKEVYQGIMQQVSAGGDEKEFEGHAVYCLRTQLTSAKRPVIHQNCMAELTQVILETEVDPRLDPVFYKKCEQDIKDKCKNELIGHGGHGTIMECMKTAYYSSHAMKPDCNREMARRTSEELSDIHLDPVLHESCALDIKHYCHDTPPGDGRIVGCLLQASKSTNTQLTPGCKSKLIDREKLWAIARKDAVADNFYLPESVGEFGQLLFESPARNSLLTVFLVIVLIIFAGGLCFGRVTKRVRAEVKNK